MHDTRAHPSLAPGPAMATPEAVYFGVLPSHRRKNRPRQRPRRRRRTSSASASSSDVLAAAEKPRRRPDDLGHHRERGALPSHALVEFFFFFLYERFMMSLVAGVARRHFYGFVLLHDCLHDARALQCRATSRNISKFCLQLCTVTFGSFAPALRALHGASSAPAASVQKRL